MASDCHMKLDLTTLWTFLRPQLGYDLWSTIYSDHKGNGWGYGPSKGYGSGHGDGEGNGYGDGDDLGDGEGDGGGYLDA